MKINKLGKKAQQEMVGFVLIVVLVMVVALIFFIIMVRTPAQQLESVKAENMLSSVLAYTSDCVISEPELANLRDIAKACYSGESCMNGQETCSYLQGKFKDVFDSVMKTETLESYSIDAVQEDSQGNIVKTLVSLKNTCNKTSSGAIEKIPVEEGDIAIRLNLCSQ